MKKFFSGLVAEVRISTERFFSTFCFTILLFLLSGYIVIFEPNTAVSKVLLQIVLTICFGMFFCTLGKMLLEKYGENIKNKWSIVESGLVLLSALAYPTLSGYQDNQYVSAGYFGVMLALFAGIIYISNTQGISKTFSYILKNTVFNGLACGIISAGTALSIYAFYSLIYKFDDIGKVYAIAMLFIWGVLFLNLSLSAIPRKDTELKIPNLFKVIIMYVALPVYLLLITILYVYMGKILITLSFPSGQINWFASFASLLFVFFVFALEQYKEENKLANMFVKFGGYVIIPIIVVQFMAMYIRLSNYGLTTSRYISFALNLIALAFAIVSLIKNGKYIKQMLIVVAGASLLLTITPVNVFDVPIWEQTDRLMTVLHQNNMIADGKIVAKEEISKEDKIKITSAYNYIDRDYDKSDYDQTQKLPHIIMNTERIGFKQIFGFSKEYEKNTWNHSNVKYGQYHYSYDVIDIEGYRNFYVVSQYNNETFKLNNSEKIISYNVKEQIEALYDKYGMDANTVKMEFQVDNNKLILTNVRFMIDESNQLTVNSINGYFLER